MKSATMRLIELAERLTPSGEIGDGMVQQFHEAAALARLEQMPTCSYCNGTRRVPDYDCSDTGGHFVECLQCGPGEHGGADGYATNGQGGR